MVSRVLGGAAGSRTSCRLAFLVTFLIVGVSSSDGGFTYQTRHTLSSPRAARYSHVAPKLGDGWVGVFGGVGHSDAELFDPTTEQFTASRATQTFGDLAGLSLPDGNALLVDGLHDCVFDYLNDRFIATQNAYTGGSTGSAVLVPLPDGKVFICGGSSDGSQPKSHCAVYDPRAMRFTSVGEMAFPRVYHTAILLDDHQVLIVGGLGSGGVALDSFEVFDTNRGASARIRTALLQARYSHCCVRLPDGRVLIAGGAASRTSPWLATAEIFDPNTAVVSQGPSMGLARSDAKAAVLPSGRIAFFGGNYDARTIEIYAPETGAFELAQSLMVDPRWSEFTATSLESGAVLLVGGLKNADPTQGPLQAAEIFEEIATDSPQSQASTPSTEAGDYPDRWCVELWGDSGVLDTVWLDSFDCPESRDVANLHRSYTAILQVAEGVDFTHLAVRFPAYASYETRVKLLNLVGWTLIPTVVLGDDLDSDVLIRVSNLDVR